MSLYDYEVSKELSYKDYPFYALIMAAMRKADDTNGELLRKAFPLVWEELHRRYHSAGGKLEHER